jgi:opacity protein-like surface antigen
MTSLLSGLLLGLAVLPADTGRAALADRIHFELRAGVAVGEARVAASGRQWDPGAAWRIGASFAALPGLDLYAGYGRNGFGCSDGFCAGNDVTFASAGLDAGLRYQVGMGWLRAGVIRHALHSDWNNAEGAGSSSSDAATGWEAGAGIAFALAPRLQLTPGIRYSTFRAALTDATTRDAVGVLTTDIGIRYRLGR